MSTAGPVSSSCVDAPYWEGRATRFARAGRGLAAVCSYGMPEYHNRAIDLGQYLALRRWLDVLGGAGRVLDVGCGVGRWSRRLAARGAQVTGIDLSPTMVDEARRRTQFVGLGDRCRFAVGDVTRLDLDERFDAILTVTVLQHVLDTGEWKRGIQALRAHLRPGGLLVALEAAPTAVSTRCDTAVFQARTTATYVEAFREAGLRCSSVAGVDPAPFRTLFLPYYRSLPAVLRHLGLAAVTAASFPVDLLLGRRCVGASWHKVFALVAEEPS
jgi:SAM-dependent methyltransferase